MIHPQALDGRQRASVIAARISCGPLPSLRRALEPTGQKCFDGLFFLV